jgi:hypothetical protein
MSGFSAISSGASNTIYIYYASLNDPITDISDQPSLIFDFMLVYYTSPTIGNYHIYQMTGYGSITFIAGLSFIASTGSFTPSSLSVLGVGAYSLTIAPSALNLPYEDGTIVNFYLEY